MPTPNPDQLAVISAKARQRFMDSLASPDARIGWSAVILTASSPRQAQRYEQEISQRRIRGTLPPRTLFAVVPDPEGRRIGSGGATLHALDHLVRAACLQELNETELEEWWTNNRVLMIHSGGDSRRLPQYSLSGKLFSPLPLRTPWGDTSTVFDEFLALSMSWADAMPNGLLVSSGDVILVFDESEVDWNRPGVSGIAMRQPPEIAIQHGVYVTDSIGAVYGFLQKPTLAELQAAGGVLPDGSAALDTGLMRFDGRVSSRLCRLGREIGNGFEATVDLYRHFTGTLTRRWRPEAEDPAVFHSLQRALGDMPFSCSLVAGEFTHIGTTALFRNLMTEETEFSRLYSASQRLGTTVPDGVVCNGVIIDSLITAGFIDSGAIILDCSLDAQVRIGRGAIAQGLRFLEGEIAITEDTVVHQIAVSTPGAKAGTLIRVYGVFDDPKASVASGNATWLGRPLGEELRSMGLEEHEVWPEGSAADRSLWTACLFPVTTPARAWACAKWLMNLPSDFGLEEWRRTPRLSLSTSAESADASAEAEHRSLRSRKQWENAALQLAANDADLRPMLAQAPVMSSLIAVAQNLKQAADDMSADQLSRAASRYFQAGLFFAQAGMERESVELRGKAFDAVARCVNLGIANLESPEACAWVQREVEVKAPARIDFGGGWSDTPPFCFDWGGTVLNASIALDGDYPIETRITVTGEPSVCCISATDGVQVTYQSIEQLLRPARPNDPFAIPRVALQLSGVFHPCQSLEEKLTKMGGGLRIITDVRLPMGSGLGTSSILAATVLKALSEMLGQEMSSQRLSELVLQLEQRMSTGGGWQDQAGGIFPGIKLLVSGPGFGQKVRLLPLAFDLKRQEELQSRLLIASTGITRVARNLLQQVVGSYLARESSTIQVLHSIKTLALEMAQALQDGDWRYLGQLLDRHWELNKLLDPNTTNAPIERLLSAARPHIFGAKLAGAGGGGFLMLVARDPAMVPELKATLIANGARPYDFQIARDGLRVKRSR